MGQSRVGRGSISFRIVFLVFAVLVVLTVVFGVLLNASTERAVNAGEQEAFRLLLSVVEHALDEKLHLAEFGVDTLAADPEVQRLLAARERDALYDVVRPYYVAVADRILRIQFHLPDGSSFLRVHEPETFGDDLSAYRPMIKAISETSFPISGIERGLHGAGLRVAKPVFFGDERVGSVEFGTDFGMEFLERLKTRYDGEFALRFFEDDGTVHRAGSTRATPRCTTSASTIERIRLGDALWEHSCTSTVGVAYYPFRLADGTVGGYIKAEVDRVRLVDELLTHRRRLVMTGLVLVALTTAGAGAGLAFFLRPVHRIVRQTLLISEEIIRGNVHFQSDVVDSPREFRQVIGAVDGIISALRSREILLQAIVEGIPGIVFYCDADLSVLWANRRARTFEPSIIGKNLRGSNHLNGFFAHENDLLTMAMTSCSVSHLSMCYTTGEAGVGGRKCWEHTAVPILDENRRVTNVVRISHDITDRKNAEDDLMALNQTLESRVHKEIARRLEQEQKAYQHSRLASIGELAAGMAHEINQPLSSIAFAIENIAAAAAGGEISAERLSEKRRRVSTDLERIRRIIDHVRAFARDDPEDFGVTFDVDHAIASARGLIAEQLRANGIELAVTPAETAPLVCGNPYQFEQVVLNVIANARDAVQERFETRDERGLLDDNVKPRIRVETVPRGSRVDVLVEDNGIGIDPALIQRVFDPFFTTKHRKGTGLGLSISYGIVQKMNGSIQIEPLDRGTRVSISIPTSETGCGQ